VTRIAIVSALHAELSAIVPLLEAAESLPRGGRIFHRGRLCGHEVLLVLSGVGKVAAAATAALALDAFGAQSLLFTGVAGGICRGVQVGDVVVARELLQHDMDASPLFPRYEVPLTGRSRFAADRALSAAVGVAAGEVLAQPHPALRRFGIASVRRHEGLVISGDRFVCTAAESNALREALPDALAVEMEGAAVAQVCADFGRPLAVLRTVSDRADDSAHVDFERFIAEVAAEFSRDIVCAALSRL
jgi:adenosylhomocysteine nucleosidase